MKDSFITDEDIKDQIQYIDKIKERSLFLTDDKSDLSDENNHNFKNKSLATSVAISAKIGEVKYRWVIFVCFWLLSFSNGLHWVTFTAIAENFKIAYDVGSHTVEFYSLSYMFLFPFIFPVAAYIIDNKSCKLGVRMKKV